MKNRCFLVVSTLTLILVLGGYLAASPAPSSPETHVVMPAAGQACSSFSLDNDGYPVFGANYDNTVVNGLLFINKRNVAKVGVDNELNVSTSWISQYGSVTFNPGTYQFVWGGMNEAGLMISTMALAETENPAPDARPALTSNYWVQYQLDNFATVEEVIAGDSIVRIEDTVDHYLVCDRQGVCAVIEFLEGEMVAYTGETLPVPSLTNSTYSQSLAMWREHAPPNDEPASVRWNDNLHRFYVAADRVGDFDPGEEESAVDYAFDTLAQIGGLRTWSYVLDAENFQVHFQTMTNSETRTLSFEDLDFSCSTPVLMWDLFADELSGDIADELFEYSHDIVLESTIDYMEKKGEDVDRAMTDEVLSSIVASFLCTKE